MPITLTTAANPGDNDPGKTYPKAKIVHFSVNLLQNQITFELGYGDVVDGSWVIGNGVRGKNFTINSDDYATMIAESALQTDGASGYEIYSGAKRVLYQWLIDNEHISGTID